MLSLLRVLGVTALLKVLLRGLLLNAQGSWVTKALWNFDWITMEP